MEDDGLGDRTRDDSLDLDRDKVFRCISVSLVGSLSEASMAFGESKEIFALDLNFRIGDKSFG